MDLRADEYELTLKLRKWKEIQLEYSEATIEESLDFLETINAKSFSLIEFVFDFIEEHGNETMTKKEFQENVVMEFSEILDILKQTRFAGIFWSENQEEKEKQVATEIDPEEMLENTKKELGKTIAYISPKMSLDPKRIIKEYTWREVIYWAEWYIYHDNEKTEEGRKANRTYENKQHIDANREEYEKEFAKLDLYLKKQKEWKKN